MKIYLSCCFNCLHKSINWQLLKIVNNYLWTQFKYKWLAVDENRMHFIQISDSVEKNLIQIKYVLQLISQAC